MILVIDNYDSFTYNLVQYMGELGADPLVFRNDSIGVEAIADHKPKGIIISPGPCRPEDAGISIDVVRAYTGKLPILGVCLGHQSIGASFGARIRRTHPLHGKTCNIRHDGSDLFNGIDSPFQGGRYHSLIVDTEDLPEVLVVAAQSEDGLVMGLRHRDHPTFGVQFHPESILTPEGKSILSTFLVECGEIQK